MSELTPDEVRAAVHPVDDAVVAEIIATGATHDELVEACHIFAREQKRIFGANDWLYACLDAELPGKGDFKRVQLGSRDVIVVRGKDGAINVLVNRCAHRSM